MPRNTVVSSYTYNHSAIKVIKVINVLKYRELFSKHAADFVRLPYLVETDEKVSKIFTSYY